MQECVEVAIQYYHKDIHAKVQGTANKATTNVNNFPYPNVWEILLWARLRFSADTNASRAIFVSISNHRKNLSMKMFDNIHWNIQAIRGETMKALGDGSPKGGKYLLPMLPCCLFSFLELPNVLCCSHSWRISCHNFTFIVGVKLQS